MRPALLLSLLLACHAGKDDTAARCPEPGPTPPILDLNGDGLADLVFAQTESEAGDYATSSLLLLGGPDGFEEASRVELPTLGADDVEAADLDGDGWLDLVFANVSDGKQRAVDSIVYFGGDFSRSLSLPTIGASAVTIDDLDGDGFPDLLFANRYSGASALDPESYHVPSRVYWGSSSGPSAERFTEIPTWGAAELRAADLDADGYKDLVVASGTFHVDASLVYWGGEGGFSEERVLSLPTLAPEGVLIADLDADGSLDLFFSNFYDIPELDVDSALYWGSAEGFSPERVLHVATHGATDAKAVDLNADGCLELVVANSMEGTFFEMDFEADSQVFWGEPGGLGARTTALPTVSAAAVDASDLDGDGDVELVFANRYDAKAKPSSLSRIYWNQDGDFDAARFTDIATVGAAGVSASVAWVP